MTDVHFQHARSHNMTCIKSKNTGPEMMLMKVLHESRCRFRMRYFSTPSSPDISVPSYCTVVLVDWCYKLAHDTCGNATLPKINSQRWRVKFNKSVVRDVKIHRTLCELCWDDATVLEWEPKESISYERLNKPLPEVR